ncbi:hypothetical protein N7462_002809 [Penicillium macrosclerotiorum]|uniref:uncharacterized protein n=1 Tax=Penicillium macrosclerotiorum TaxID=303699 RepID=UPI0025480077|nr:uncharacterized protein N7462_002809 [Penicillium macrosclerotiorum]KAJ5693386.1 hypothetical protein N7462_002809 [Penicillium macrosclerotiorum]
MNLVNASHLEREQLLEDYEKSSMDHTQALMSGPQSSKSHATSRGSLLRMKEGIASQFFGDTSFYPIVPCIDEDLEEDLKPTRPESAIEAQKAASTGAIAECASDVISVRGLTPHSPICEQAMSAFFQHAYYYHMVLYREYFLRDYKAGKGLYYSEALLYAIVSIGAVISNNDSLRDLAEVFSDHAERLIYSGALHSPNITTIQALLLMGQFQIGRRNETKGWLFTGLSNYTVTLCHD